MPRRDPFREIEELFDRMNRELQDISGGLGVKPGVDAGIKVDVAEDDEAVTVTADVPGFDREDIDVAVEDDVLTIAAEHEEETEEEGEEGEEETYHRRERRRRSASRRIRLPAAVEEADATAEYANGVLTITLPKVGPEDAEGHSIDVE
ncbi:Hsp20/alpha crystallin family protein [Haloparvum sp. AD34]